MFHLITSWMTSLWGIQQITFAWRPSCFFSTLPALFSPSVGRRTIVTSESKVQRRFTALCRWWGPHWEPPAVALWSCLAEWMDSAALHLLQAITIIKVWSQARLCSSTTWGLPLADCFGCACVCDARRLCEWKWNWFHLLYSISIFKNLPEAKLAKLRGDTTTDDTKTPVQPKH